MSFIKDNGGPLVIGAAVLAIVGGYIELRLPNAVNDAVKAATDEKIEAINAVSPDRMKAAEENIQELKHADDKFDDKITRIIDILLEE